MGVLPGSCATSHCTENLRRVRARASRARGPCLATKHPFSSRVPRTRVRTEVDMTMTGADVLELQGTVPAHSQELRARWRLCGHLTPLQAGRTVRAARRRVVRRWDGRAQARAQPGDAELGPEPRGRAQVLLHRGSERRQTDARTHPSLAGRTPRPCAGPPWVALR